MKKYDIITITRKGIIMEKYREIERSIIKKYRKEIWSKFIKAIKDYKLINENDNIMVCISKLRDKLDEDPTTYIKTIRGLGYRLEK